MRYTTEIEIDLPREKVVELYEDPQNLKYWQEGFLSMEHLGGLRGKEGATSLLKYRSENGVVEIMESVVKKELPHKYYLIYESKGIWNGIRNHFHKVNGQKTRWKSHIEFRFIGRKKIAAWLSPGKFKKESKKHMEDFKNFAERAR